MSVEAARNFQVFDTWLSGFSQPCALNSPRWGGSSEDIFVETLPDLNAHEDCLPDFLQFDIDAITRQSYNDLITCPIITWKVPDSTASVNVRFSLRNRPHGKTYEQT